MHMHLAGVLTQRVASFLTWADLGRWRCTSKRARARTSDVICQPVPWSRLKCLFHDTRNTHFMWVFQTAAGLRWAIQFETRRCWLRGVSHVNVHVWCNQTITADMHANLCAHAHAVRRLPWTSSRVWNGNMTVGSCALEVARAAAALASMLGIDTASAVDTNVGISDWIRARLHTEVAHTDIFFQSRQLVRVERLPTRLCLRPLANMAPDVRVEVPDYIRPNAASDAVCMFDNIAAIRQRATFFVSGWTSLGTPLMVGQLYPEDSPSRQLAVCIESIACAIPAGMLERLCTIASMFGMSRSSSSTCWTFASEAHIATYDVYDRSTLTPRRVRFFIDDATPYYRLIQLVFHVVGLRDVGNEHLHFVQDYNASSVMVHNICTLAAHTILERHEAKSHLFPTVSPRVSKKRSRALSSEDPTEA